MIIKIWIRYFIYAIAIFTIVFVNEHFISVSTNAYRHFTANYNLLILIPIFFNVLTGCLLGAQQLIVELKKKGSWSINTPKLVIIGIPSLVLSFTFFWAYTDISLILNLMMRLIAYGYNYIPVSQIIFGYILTTSFYKKSESNGFTDSDKLNRNK